MDTSHLSGQELGAYKLGRLLGKGGMGSVYESYQSSVKRKVAIKLLVVADAETPQYVERFHREIEIAASLEHLHIVPIYDHGIDKGISYVVMRLLTGGSLSEQLKGDAAFTPHEKIRILRQIATALHHAHTKGIVHRDLKPANILFDESGNAYLADFGIAKVLQSVQPDLTKTNMVMGTPQYMAPEQWQAQPINSRADIYALGILAYQLLTGRVPFEAETPYAIMHKHLNEFLPSLTEYNFPEAVDQVLGKAVAKNPDMRFTSSIEFIDYLEGALSGKSIRLPDSTVLWSSAALNRPATQSTDTTNTLIQRFNWQGKQNTGILLALLVIIGLVLLIFFFRNNPSPDRHEEPAAQSTFEVSATLPVVQSTTQATAINTVRQQPSLTATSEVLVSSQAAIALEQTEALSVPTNTWTPIPTPTEIDITATLNFLLTEQAQFTYQTQTAIAPTSTVTPTATQPDLTATLNFLLTEYAIFAKQTETAYAPTITPSPTATLPPPPTSTIAQAIPTFLPARSQLTRNRDWTPIYDRRNDLQVVFVPSGCFMMGSNAASDEQPIHEICVDGFWLGRYEVTNTQYDPSTSAPPNQPRNSVTWLEASAYCTRIGGRLPTEAEWEYAARGPESWLYPWGNNTPTRDLLNWNNVLGRPSDVGSFPQSDSWVGASDMAGNVAEWTNSLYWYYPYSFTDGRENTNDRTNLRILRGGSYGSNLNGLSITHRGYYYPNETTEFRGFRCAFD